MSCVFLTLVHKIAVDDFLNDAPRLLGMAYAVF